MLWSRWKLAEHGLSLSLYALYEIGLSTFLMFPFWLVATLILWRAENRWIGWFTAMILATLGAVNTLDVFNITQAVAARAGDGGPFELGRVACAVRLALYVPKRLDERLVGLGGRQWPR